MDWRGEWKWLVVGTGAFAAVSLLPVGTVRFDGAVLASLHLLKWYAREHVMLCLIPAFFIAGAISVFVSQGAVMKYLGANANKAVAYAVASVSGTILAVCSCTVLPLFAGIYKRGAGIGPATAFLYSGPAINVLAIVLTARVLGWKLGTARAVGAIVFSVVIGLIMSALFRAEEAGRTSAALAAPPARPHFAPVLTTAAAIFVVALVAAPVVLLPVAIGLVGISFLGSRSKEDAAEWVSATWDFAKQITPLLFAGVLLAGFLLGRPGHEGIVPSEWINRSVGGNSLGANLFASAAGALMYFATLTEVPIVQGLVGSGMGEGPALALLLAGPALSLPSILVLHSVLGTAKTSAYVVLVVAMATISGLAFGAIA